MEPARQPRPRRARALELTNITADDELIRYAAIAQIALLYEKHKITAKEVGDAMRMDPGHLTRALRPQADLPPGGKPQPTVDLLNRLDTALIALAPDVSPGGLVSFAVRIRRMRGRDGAGARIPASLVDGLLRERPDDPATVIVQASSIFSMFLGAWGREEELADRYEAQIAKIAERLILIGIEPPASLNVKALILLGSLGSYAFDAVRPCLERELWEHPLGFRVWRAVTAVVQAVDDWPNTEENHESESSAEADDNSPLTLDDVPFVTGEGSPSRRSQPTDKALRHADEHRRWQAKVTDEVKQWVRGQLGQAAELRKRSPYPARSLDLELAKSIPIAWSPAADDWAGAVLLERARLPQASTRERGSAVLGYWNRTLQHQEAAPNSDHRDAAKPEMDALLAFLDEESRRDGSDPHSGLQWVIATLKDNIDHDVGVGNTWPKWEGELEPQYRRAVRLGASELDNMPPIIKEATKFVFEHTLLQNAGVYRRRAVDTLRATGWAEKLVAAYTKVLEESTTERWLRTRALFAVGFLQYRHKKVRILLTKCFRDAAAKLDGSQASTPELHATIFALGDCYGARNADTREVELVRQDLAKVLVALVEPDREPVPDLVARAILYLVTSTTDADPEGSRRILQALSQHPDSVAAKAATEAVKRLDSEVAQQ